MNRQACFEASWQREYDALTEPDFEPFTVEGVEIDDRGSDFVFLADIAIDHDGATAVNVIAGDEDGNERQATEDEIKIVEKWLRSDVGRKWQRDRIAEWMPC